MRVGAVRSGADDNECHLRMSLGDNRFGDIGGDVGLGPAGDQKLRHPGVHPVDGRAGLAQRVDLGTAVLTIRSPRITSVASTGSTPSTPASGNRCSAGMESVTAVAAGAPPNASPTNW